MTNDPWEDPLPLLNVTEEIGQHGHSVLLRWSRKAPTYRDAHQMAAILYREADRLARMAPPLPDVRPLDNRPQPGGT